MTCYGRRGRHQLAGKAKGQLFTNRMKYLIRALLTLSAIVSGLPALLYRSVHKSRLYQRLFFYR
ncbi:MAG TPA: hypothetical protein V6D34_11400 [Candidatus Sericytochromatia bacterium]